MIKFNGKIYEKGKEKYTPIVAITAYASEKDKEKYLAIGESDRMTLKFIKK